MTVEECEKFNSCEVSICPMDEQNGCSIWYPDEPICSLKKFQSVDWIKRQKAIAKTRIRVDRYFTREMLEVVNHTRKNVIGIDPDQSIEGSRRAEQRWVKTYKREVIV